LSLNGWHVFWWLVAMIGIDAGSPVAENAAGGFIAGYIIHILVRIFNFHSTISSNTRQINKL
jgi:hypothetical protein